MGYEVIVSGFTLIAIDKELKPVAEATAPMTKLAARLLVEAVYKIHSERVRELQKHRCAICGHLGRLEIDHIIPRSRGRNDRIDNLQAVCASFSGGCRYHQLKHGG